MKYLFDINEYADKFQKDKKQKIIELAKIIENNLPDEAIASLSYNMPSYKVNQYIIHFAGYGQYLSIYIGNMAIEALKEYLNKFSTTKSSFRISWDAPIPMDIIQKAINLNLQNSKKIE